MPEEATTPPADAPAISGKLQSLFADGTIQYDGQIGPPAQFPLTPAELAEVAAFVPPAPLPPPVPTFVSMRQARTVLLTAGLMPQVDAALAALPSPQRELAQIEWEYSNEVHRHRPFVQGLGAALGLSAEQLDALFVQAAQL